MLFYTSKKNNKYAADLSEYSFSDTRIATLTEQLFLVLVQYLPSSFITSSKH